jgi:NADH:ubiquinone oxidoreductase subunit K
VGCLFSFIVVIAPWSYFNYVIYHDPFKYAKVASDVIRLDLTTTFSVFIASTLREVTPWILLFLCVGIYGFLRERNIFMLAWLSGSLAVFLTITHKESRYLADFFPLIAITAASGYEALDPMLGKKSFLALFLILSCVSFAIGMVDVYEKKDIGEPLIYVGIFISSHTPKDSPIIANEESQMYYYTGRKINPFPKTREEFETLQLERKVIFMVVNSYRKPDYFEEIVDGWEEIFMRGSYTVYRRRDYGCTLCLF